MGVKDRLAGGGRGGSEEFLKGFPMRQNADQDLRMITNPALDGTRKSSVIYTVLLLIPRLVQSESFESVPWINS